MNSAFGYNIKLPYTLARPKKHEYDVNVWNPSD